LLGASRRAYEGRRDAEKENWKWSADYLIGKQMSGKKLGIIGMGNIGRAVAQRARGFDMEIHYHNRSRLDPSLENGAIYHKDLKDLLKNSEFLSINCPGSKETENLINEETINYLPDRAVVANAARGEVIDDEAMIQAMKSGKIFGLGLDVYKGEPKINPKYLELNNLFLLPHLGSATKKTRIAMGDRAIDNLEAFFSGNKPKDKVN
jgi:lactate dehydrogenase-like 2-hydroxyacid dehydrogenase